MKQSFLPILICISIIQGQTAYAQLAITSDSFPAPVYFCNGINLQPEGIAFNFGIYNLNAPYPVIVMDSCTVTGTRNAFTLYNPTMYPWNDTIPYYESVGETYTPPSPGVDTFRIVVYYQGKSVEGVFIFTALYLGVTSLEGQALLFNQLGYPGSAIGTYDMTLTSDTLHDVFSLPLYVGSTPANASNDAVQITSCGGDAVDTVREVGDFSEINFEVTPTAPFEVLADSSISFSYTVTPKHVGTFPHYLVFHTVSGHYLVWSFEYTVDAASSVSPIIAESEMDIRVFPNPATDELQILGGPRIGDDAAGTIHLFDVMGRERITANDDGTGAMLDVSRLEPGIYFLREGNQATKVEISR